MALTLVSCLAGPRAAEPSPPVVPATAEEILKSVREPGAAAVVVNLWATWCVPCVEELPDLLRLRSEYGDRGLRLVLVSLDFGEDRDERVRAFLRERGIDFGSYLKDGPDRAFVEGLDADWSGILPSTLIYDGHGERRALIEGQTTHARLVEEVAPLLRPAPGRAEERARSQPPVRFARTPDTLHQPVSQVEVAFR